MKWTGSVGVGGEALLTADARSDIAGEEVFHAGGPVAPNTNGRVTCLNGRTGAQIWTRQINNVGDTCQIQMADVDNNGDLEIIVPLQTPAGLYILNAQDGTVMDSFTNLGGRCDSSPVAGDVNGNGYPDIFLGIMAYEEQPETGKIIHYEYNPSTGHVREVRRRVVWHPCAGGLSLGDTDNDGVYELYMADRSIAGMVDGSWGRGLRSFWAENLTSRWDVYDWMMSSNIPMIADVNKDGIRDIVATDLSRGVMVLNSSNGRPLTNNQGTVLRGSIPERRNHYQSSVYDIDGDGSLEIISADGFEGEYDNVTVWDLWNWRLDASINTTLVGTVPTRSWKGPTVGEVTGDGLKDIIVTTFEFQNNSNRGMVQVYDRNFNLVAYTANNLQHRAIESVVQDVDRNDGGLNELLVLTQGGVIYCFDTLGRSEQLEGRQRARSEVQFYSESRLGASEYVPYGSPYTNASYPPSPPTPNNVPTHGTPLLSGSADNDNLVCNNQSTSDPDRNPVTNIYSWAKNGVSIANLILPFDSKTSSNLEYSGFAYTKDYSDRGNIGNVFGASWTSAGKVGGAYSFDGNDFIRIEEQGNSLGGDGTWEEIAVEFWVKATENTGNETLLWKHHRYEFSKGGYTPPSGVGYRVDFASDAVSNQISWYVYTPDPSNASLSIEHVVVATISDSAKQWHHIVCTYDSGVGLRIYVDGAQASFLSGVSGRIMATNGAARSRNLGTLLGDWGYPYSGGMVDTNKGPLEIARDRTSNDFKGILDEVRIYPKAISANQIYLRYTDTRNGLSIQSTLSNEETTVGEQWLCRVTPNDGLADGTTRNSNAVTIVPSGTTQYRLTINVQGTGSTNPSAGSYLYSSGTIVQVSAIAGSNYQFSHWLRNGTNYGSDNPCSIIMNANYILTAVFIESSTGHLFADDFETGTLAAWDGQDGTTAISTASPHQGTYHLGCSLSSGANNVWSGAYKSITGNNPVYLSAYVRFNAPPDTNEEDQWALAFTQSTAGSALAYAGIRQVSGTLYWAIWYISSGTTLTYNVSSTPYTSGWHNLQLAI
ncbi:MAG: hypothetical protein NWE95_02265, partial [Candidatus Bathyarchaeota archaeon]|nr:hypothetical protein [Candidatus Bathyarchaeota archaeon]